MHPGSEVATGDVFTGLVGGLRRLGHHVDVYALGHRITLAGVALKTVWRWHKQNGGPLAAIKPGVGDIVHEASTALVYQFFRGPAGDTGPYDAVVVVTGMYLHPDILVVLKRAGVPVGLLLSESPYDMMKEFRVARLANVCWTNERASVQVLRYANPNTHYLSHAHDPEKHTPAVPEDEPDVPAHDVVFVGTAFEERIWALEAVDWSGIDLGLYGNWGLLGSRHRLRRHVRAGVVTNAMAAALYRRAKIGLNLYRSSMGYGRGTAHVLEAHSLNPRALELAACGVFTISDWRSEVAEVFGWHVPTFRAPGELEPLLRWWLADDGARAGVAALLPACVRGRTFDAMAAQVAADLERVLAALAAPYVIELPPEDDPAWREREDPAAIAQAYTATLPAASGTFDGEWETAT